MKAQIIQQFTQGETVPTWLLDQEPGSAEAKGPAEIAFQADCVLLQTEKSYVLTGLEFSKGPLIEIRSPREGVTLKDITIFAPETDLVIAAAHTHIARRSQGRKESA